MNHARLHRNPGSHLLGMVLVTLMHLALAYALVTGLARRVIEVVHVPVQTNIIDEITPPPPEPQAEPTITVSNVAPPPLPVTIVPLPSVSPGPALAIPAVPAAAPDLTRPAQLDVSRCAKPEYPAAARRTSATGSRRRAASWRSLRATVQEVGICMISSRAAHAHPTWVKVAAAAQRAIERNQVPRRLPQGRPIFTMR